MAGAVLDGDPGGFLELGRVVIPLTSEIMCEGGPPKSQY